MYDGRRYRLERLFTIEDVTREVDKADRDLPALLKGDWRILDRNSPPDIDPGPGSSETSAGRLFSATSRFSRVSRAL